MIGCNNPNSMKFILMDNAEEETYGRLGLARSTENFHIQRLQQKQRKGDNFLDKLFESIIIEERIFSIELRGPEEKTAPLYIGYQDKDGMKNFNNIATIELIDDYFYSQYC